MVIGRNYPPLINPAVPSHVPRNRQEPHHSTGTIKVTVMLQNAGGP